MQSDSRDIRHIVPTVALLGIVLLSALSVTYSVFTYREEFKALQQLKRAQTSLNEEWTKLLIEQQTFGSSAQIGSRAVLMLGMYSPPANQIVTLSLLPHEQQAQSSVSHE